MSHLKFSNPIDSLVDLLAFRARSQPDVSIFTFLDDHLNETHQLTFCQLETEARAIAVKLLQTHRVGDRALLLYEPGTDFIAGFFGCLYAGILPVPAYPPQSPRDFVLLESIMLDCSATLVCTSAHLQPLVSAWHNNLLSKIRNSIHANVADAAISQRSQAQLLQSEELIKAIQIISTDAVNQLVAQQWVPPTLTKASIAFLQYTSGSTGDPKGVLVSHGNLLANSQQIQRVFGANESSQGVIWLPPYHDMGLIGGIIQPIFSGFPCALMSPMTFLKHPIRWVEAIDRYQATISGGPNFAYELVLKHIDEALMKQLNLSSWQVAFNGAEAIRYETLTAFQDRFAECGFVMRSFLPCYGLAEATLLAAGCSHDQEPLMVHVDQRVLAQHKVVLLDERDAGQDPKRSVTLIGCGEPVTDGLCIVNPESKQLCQDQEVGEIWIRGDSVARGYWGNLTLSQGVFAADLELVDASDQAVGHGSFLRTGDLGFVYQQQLYVTGRLKELIIVNGLNHYPVDIERTVQAVDSAFRTGCGAAFSLTIQGVEQLVLVQEIRQERLDDIDLENALSQLKTAIFSAHRLTPFDIVLIRPKTLPKTTSGKIQRVETRRQYREGELASLMSLLETNSVVSTQSDVTNNALASSEVESSGIADPSIGGLSKENLSREKSNRETLGVDHYRCLIIELLEGLNYEVKSVGLDTSFVDLGLDSKDAVGMIGLLEDELKMDLDVSIVFNYPSIAKLAGFLAGECENPHVATDKSDHDATSDSRSTLDNEPMAIVGMACQFPGGGSVNEFWQSLLDGVDAITPVPQDRWEVDSGYAPNPATPGKYCSRWGGFLNAVDEFDASLFGISPKEAALMDPQQRLLLECSWHAIEQAGMNPQSLAGSNTGVFVGISSSDYFYLVMFNYMILMIFLL